MSRRIAALVCSILLLFSPLFLVNNYAQIGISPAFQISADLPPTCNVGQIVYVTNAVLFYTCTSTNSWVALVKTNDTRLSDSRVPTTHASTHLVNGSDPVDLFARVTGSNATTTGQALVNVTGLSVALAVNSVYTYEAVLSVSTTAVTTGTKYGVNYSVAGGAVEGQITCSLTATASMISERVSALNTANTTACLTTSGQTGAVYMRGIITTGANAGNFTVSHLKVTSGTSTVFINSYMKVTKVA